VLSEQQSIGITGCVSRASADNEQSVRSLRGARGGGASFAVRAWMFHQVHLTYSATTLAACAVYHFARRTREESRSTDHRDPH
jgi:hypothetical protein